MFILYEWQRRRYKNGFLRASPMTTVLITTVWYNTIKSKIGYFQYEVPGKGHNVIDFCVIYKGFISWVCMPHMKFLSRTVQKLWPWLKFLQTDKKTESQTRRKVDAHEFIQSNCHLDKEHFLFHIWTGSPFRFRSNIGQFFDHSLK